MEVIVETSRLLEEQNDIEKVFGNFNDYFKSIFKWDKSPDEIKLPQWETPQSKLFQILLQIYNYLSGVQIILNGDKF